MNNPFNLFYSNSTNTTAINTDSMSIEELAGLAIVTLCSIACFLGIVAFIVKRNLDQRITTNDYIEMKN